MLTTYNDPTIPPRYIVEGYRKAYARIHSREPQCRYIGNHWYNVNGETVHRATLTDEIARLRNLDQRDNSGRPDRTIIQRLIDRLRGM